MALARSRRNESGFNYWPGFVDALSTLVLSIVFLLSVFLVVQFFLSQEVTGKDNGRPGIRAHYDPDYYGAFVLDPDGHNIEAVCRRPE